MYIFLHVSLKRIMPFLRLTLGPLNINYQSKTLVITKKKLNTGYNTPTNLLSYTVKNRDLLY